MESASDGSGRMTITMNSDTREIWQGIADTLSKDRPYVGRIVTVDRGKHAGKTGIVRRHQEDRFVNAFRYCDGAQAQMRQMAGRWGFCVQIETEDREMFWTKADNVTCKGERS